MTATTITTTPTTLDPTISRPHRARVFRAVIRAEWTKMRSVRSTMWTLLVALGLAISFGATSFSLSGLFLSQIAIGVLGVLLITSEYATGQIRATLAATPQRVTVLAAKTVTFVAVVVAVGLVASFGAFFVGQAIFSAKGLDASLGDPEVLRAVIGGALYLAAMGLLGLGIGTILRRTAGAISAFVGMLVVVPIVTGFLPSSWNESVGRFFPARAGMAVFNVLPDPASLSPWIGFAVLVGYAAIALIVGGLLLTRRDA